MKEKLSWVCGSWTKSRSEIPKNESASIPITIHTISRSIGTVYTLELDYMKVDVEALALAHFKKHDAVLYNAAKRFKGTLTSRVKPRRTADELFRALAGSVVSQQLSTKAAATIWARLEEACGGSVTPLSISKIRVERMRKAGLSAAKAKTLKELARAVKGGLDLPALKKLPEEIAIERLTEVWGIGTWTAEMFLIFALGRADVFSPKDLGVMRAIEDLYGVAKDSKPHAYVVVAECWSPYRSVACLALWRHRDE